MSALTQFINDIVSRVPDMAKDCATNNEQLLKNLCVLHSVSPLTTAITCPGMPTGCEAQKARTENVEGGDLVLVCFGCKEIFGEERYLIQDKWLTVHCPDRMFGDVVYKAASCPGCAGRFCQCWFSINTGPNGECEKCGKPQKLSQQ